MASVTTSFLVTIVQDDELCVLNNNYLASLLRGVIFQQSVRKITPLISVDVVEMRDPALPSTLRPSFVAPAPPPPEFDPPTLKLDGDDFDFVDW